VADAGVADAGIATAAYCQSLTIDDEYHAHGGFSDGYPVLQFQEALLKPVEAGVLGSAWSPLNPYGFSWVTVARVGYELRSTR